MRLALLLLLALAFGRAACLNWKFWELFYSKEEVPSTGLALLETWDRAEVEDIVQDTEDYLSFMEGKASHIVSMVRSLEEGGRGIYQVIRQIFAYNEGVNISDAAPKEDKPASIETAPTKSVDAASTTKSKPADANAVETKPAEDPKPAEKPAAASKSEPKTAPTADEKQKPAATDKPASSTKSETDKPAAVSTSTSAPTTAHKSFVHRLAERAEHLLKSVFGHLLGHDKHAQRAARLKRHSEVAKMAQAYIESQHVAAATLRKATSPGYQGHKQPQPLKSASHRAAARHLLSKQSEDMAETWHSYFKVSEDMEKHVKQLQDLITRIKAPGLELVSVFKSLPPRKEKRTED